MTGLQWAPISFNSKSQILGRKISDQSSMGQMCTPGPASYGLRGSQGLEMPFLSGKTGPAVELGELPGRTNSPELGSSKTHLPHSCYGRSRTNLSYVYQYLASFENSRTIYMYDSIFSQNIDSMHFLVYAYGFIPLPLMNMQHLTIRGKHLSPLLWFLWEEFSPKYFWSFSVNHFIPGKEGWLIWTVNLRRINREFSTQLYPGVFTKNSKFSIYSMPPWPLLPKAGWVVI